MDDTYDMLIKILFIGDSGTGKSCIIIRECDDHFIHTYLSTIGVDFKIKTIKMNGVVVKMQIWDTAGQERFRTLTTNYYRGAEGVFIVFDVTDYETFKDVGNWLNEVNKYCDKGVKKILLGNKIDMVDKRCVTYEEASTFAKNNNMIYLETSAKTGKNINDDFNYMMCEIVKDKPIRLKSEKTSVNLSIEKSTSYSKCCLI